MGQLLRKRPYQSSFPGTLFRLLILFLCLSATAHATEFNPDWGPVGVFNDAQTCALCHRASSDDDSAVPAVMRNPIQDDGEDVSPSHQWRHSIMAHAFDDPYFLAAVEHEVSLSPGLAGTIEDKCLTCHAPMARTHAHQTDSQLTEDTSCLLPDGCFRLATADGLNHAREGVSCTLCHQIRADNLGSSESFSGGFSIASEGDPDDFSIYGPYPNPHRGGATAMQGFSGYTPSFGDHMNTSFHCASCHTLFTPVIDVATGTPTGAEFLEQGAALEWQNSDYFSGRSEASECQDCHMPEPVPGSYSTRIAIQPNGSVNSMWPERSPFFTHSMVGGNTYLLALLRDNRAELGIENTTSVNGFNEKITQTRDLLENDAASLDITRIALAGNTLDIDVLISNKTGHKLPTGYPSRRMWLNLVVRDAAERIIFESGTPDSRGHISVDASHLATDCLAVDKPPGFTNAGCFEPHQDIIDDPSRIAVYESVLEDTAGDITHVLLHASRYLKDNRIPPEGFTLDQAAIIEPQTLPRGVDGDDDFNAANQQEGSGSDTVHYQVSIDEPDSRYTVEARLLYQSIKPDFAAGLHGDGSKVTRFKTMYEASTPVIETLALTSATLTDTDRDRVADPLDNCILVPNVDQRNTDEDPFGNICDPDFDNNLSVDFSDLSFLKSVFFTANPDADLDGNGSVDFADLSVLKAMFFGPPGPSGLAP